MAKIISTDGKILTGDDFPSLQIGDKLYTVDNRLSTYKKIQKIDPNSTKYDPDVELIKLALGEKAAKEIIEINLSVESFSNLTFFIMSAITGEDFDTLKKAAKEAKN